MKRILFLLLLTVSVYGQNPSRFAKIQITGNTISGTATKAVVQESNGELNTKPLETTVIQSSTNPITAGAVFDGLAKKPTLATIAQIRALSGALSNNYFYTTDLGQEGNWYYDSTDTTTADNTGTVLVTSDGKRIKRIFEKNEIQIEWFSGLNDSDRCQNAINYLIANKGGKIKLLSKKYVWTTTVYVNPVNEIPISIEGVNDYERDVDDGSENNGTVIEVSSAIDCFRVNLNASGASVKPVDKQYFGFSAKNIIFSGKGGVTGSGGVGGIVGFRMFRTRAKFENLTANRIDYLILQPDADSNAAANYCDMSSYNNIKIVQSRYGGLRLYITDGSVINGFYFENPNSTCKYGLEIFGGSGTSINGVVLGLSANHALIAGGSFIRLSNCNGISLNGLHFESSKFESLFDIFYCNSIIINSLHTRFFYNNAVSVTNSVNVNVDGWDGWASPAATYSDLKIIGTEAENGNITVQNYALSTYPSRTPRNIVISNSVLGSTVIRDNYINLSGVMKVNSAKSYSVFFNQKLAATANNNVLSTIVSRSIYNSNGFSNVTNYALDSDAPILVTANSGSVFEGRNTSGIFKSRITGGGFLYINRINGLDSSGNPTLSYFEYISDDLLWTNNGSQRLKMFASDGRMVIGNTSLDTGEMLQVFGKGKFYDTVIIPNGTLSTHAVNKGQLDALATSGTYTPTLTAGANITSLTFNSAFYTKVGNVVTARITVTFSTTAGNTVSNFNFSLPLNKTGLTSISLGNGTSITGASVSNSVDVLSTASNNTATASFISGAGSGVNGKATIFIMYDVTQ